MTEIDIEMFSSTAQKAFKEMLNAAEEPDDRERREAMNAVWGKGQIQEVFLPRKREPSSPEDKARTRTKIKVVLALAFAVSAFLVFKIQTG